MVLLATTQAAKTAFEKYKTLQCSTRRESADETDSLLSRISALDIGSPVDHDDLIRISTFLLGHDEHHNLQTHQWRLDTLLKGASVYRPPPPTKPEPTLEYKALMHRLRREEEQRQYEHMSNPQPQQEIFGQRFPNAANAFHPATSIGQGPDAKEVDEVTFADVNRQMALIINVLISIIACSVAIWIAARRWTVPQRLGLSMCGSCLVAVAEVAIYMGYIRRIQESKDKEKKVVERKEIVESWVIDRSTGEKAKEAEDGIRYRKGKHR